MFCGGALNALTHYTHLDAHSLYTRNVYLAASQMGLSNSRYL